VFVIVGGRVSPGDKSRGLQTVCRSAHEEQSIRGCSSQVRVGVCHGYAVRIATKKSGVCAPVGVCRSANQEVSGRVSV
jgi:hypothetical protein